MSYFPEKNIMFDTIRLRGGGELVANYSSPTSQQPARLIMPFPEYKEHFVAGGRYDVVVFNLPLGLALVDGSLAHIYYCRPPTSQANTEVR